LAFLDDLGLAGKAVEGSYHRDSLDLYRHGHLKLEGLARLLGVVMSSDHYEDRDQGADLGSFLDHR